MSTSRIPRLTKILGLAAAISVCALVAGPTAPAHAAINVYGAPVSAALTPKQRLAIATFKKANARFKAGDFAGALPLFQQAEQLHPGGAPKFKIAECYDKLGRNAEAVAAYKVFIDSKPGAKYKDRVVKAGQRIAQLQASLPAKAKLVVNPPGLAYTVMVDGTAAQGPVLDLTAGQHTIEVTAPNHQPQRQQVNVQGGQETTLNFTLQPAQVAPPPQPKGKGNPGLPFIIGGIAAGGVALGAGVATTVFGVGALGAKDDFDAATTPGSGATVQQQTEFADDAENKALLADVFLGVGIGCGIGAGVLLVLGLTASGEEGASAAIPEVTPMVGTNGGGTTLKWSF